MSQYFFELKYRIYEKGWYVYEALVPQKRKKVRDKNIIAEYIKSKCKLRMYILTFVMLHKKFNYNIYVLVFYNFGKHTEQNGIQLHLTRDA